VNQRRNQHDELQLEDAFLSRQKCDEHKDMAHLKIFLIFRSAGNSIEIFPILYSAVKSQANING
jgi:hypothetical protein